MYEFDTVFSAWHGGAGWRQNPRGWFPARRISLHSSQRFIIGPFKGVYSVYPPDNNGESNGKEHGKLKGNLNYWVVSRGNTFLLGKAEKSCWASLNMSLPSSQRSPISYFVSNMRLDVRMPASHVLSLGFGFELQLRCCFEQLCAQTARGVSSPGSQYTLLPLITHPNQWLDSSPYPFFLKGWLHTSEV